MARRLVTKRTVFVWFDLPFGPDKRGKFFRPGVEFFECVAVTRQVLGLIVAVSFVLAEFNMVPQFVRHFDSAVTALPHQRCVTVPVVLKRLVVGIKVMFMGIVEQFGAAF